MTVGCKLALGRGQELKPFFLLFYMLYTPFSLTFLVTKANSGNNAILGDRLTTLSVLCNFTFNFVIYTTVYYAGQLFLLASLSYTAYPRFSGFL